MSQPLVTIVMSTYNGEKFIRGQLDSLIAQECEDWCLLIRDDGSSDGTIDVIANYEASEERIRLVKDECGNLGPARSFIHLLGQVRTSFFMCCDQDDVWLPHKVGEAVARLTGKGELPALFFTDLVVVDGNLGVIAGSFMAHQNFDPRRASSLKGLLLQNVVVGCTMAGNRALLKLVREQSLASHREMLMHDWWLALLAAALGTIEYSSTPSILYRQHGGNSLGAPGSNLRRYVTMLLNSRPWERASVYLCKVSVQCSAFMRAYGSSLTEADFAAVERVAGLVAARSPIPLVGAFIAGISMNGLLRNIALALSVLIHPTWRNASFRPNVAIAKKNI
ncbi:glycosyltransferase family 2 protein [Paraburkholderia dipogonis]|nr:glycosyltransferase family 2 protein [Paraburkholderia dipogonis]